ncbi:MAG: hypothetical protein EKK55_13535 [Rhodocyclaceae bacterium]|nr:MAG: hypothetical protein EKK55_13535 [Rhodocyclaceae bacterium]
MRYSVIATGSLVVWNSAGLHKPVDLMRRDRAADDVGFPGERTVRLPRRLCRPAKCESRDAVLRRLNAGALSIEEWRAQLDEYLRATGALGVSSAAP